MNAPDIIFMPNELLSEEWGRHIEGQDTEYIRKDAILEWAKEWHERYPYSHEFEMIIDKINSL